jgi:hypothetical protein
MPERAKEMIEKSLRLAFFVFPQRLREAHEFTESILSIIGHYAGQSLAEAFSDGKRAGFTSPVRLPQILRLMSEDSILRYTDLAALIQMARARGWPTIRIVRSMSLGLTYTDALKLARKAAPLLDISVSEFMRLRKNE